MEKTIHTLLTDADMRSTEDVEKQLQAELSAGAPWFNVTENDE